MNRFKLFLPSLMVAGAVGLAGCPADDEPMSTGTETSGTTAPTTSGTTSGTDTSSGTETSSTTTDTDTTTTTDTETGTDTATGTTGDPLAYDFRDDAPDAYTRVDRSGLPAVSTAFILPANKDAYNAADPVDDVMDDFFQDIQDSTDFYHRGPGAAGGGEGLDDDLAAIPLTACTAPANGVGLGTCITDNLLGGNLLAPDALRIDTEQDAGFPNGRALEDPVMDLLLGLLLLDLGSDPFDAADGGPHHVDALANVPLNPAANDLTFQNVFPYLADAQ